jgi:two-component system cell cycle response regulator
MAAVLPRLLVVDDNDDERQMLLAALSARYEVIEASDGMDAYALACAEQPAAIVLDVAMPILDGWEVLRKLRANAETKHIPVVIFTALEAEAIRGNADSFGVLTVRKPVAPSALEAAIKRAINRSS